MTRLEEKRVGPRGADLNGLCADGERGHPISRVAVVQRNCNFSAFNGYRWTPSDYSLVRCECGWSWRTKARYVGGLKDGNL